MKVILLEDVTSLGDAGAIVDVANGYGRNFLLPKGLAIAATSGAMKNLEKTRQDIAKKQNRLQAEAQALAKKIQASPLTMSARAGEDGRLHGSITTQDIHEALAAKGIEVDKRRIHLDEPIRVAGSHSVTIKLGSKTEATLQLEVTPEAHA